MPIGLHPIKTFTTSLTIDAGIPEPERPAFVMRFLTPAKEDTLRDIMAKMWASVEGAETNVKLTPAEQDASYEPHLTDALQVGVVGWERMNDGEGLIPFSIDAMRKYLTIRERIELAWKQISGGRLNEEDKKKYELQRASTAVESAKPAPAESADPLEPTDNAKPSPA